MRNILMLAFCLITGVVTAQEKYFYFAVDVNKPMSNTEWIDKTSAHGFRIGYRGFINDKFSAGLDVGTTTFEQYNPTETSQNGNWTITTDYFKYVYSYSATLSGQYNFAVGDRETFFPYVGLGLGANNNQYVIYYNIYQDTETSWGFLARPEAGVLVRIGRRGTFGVMGAVHYDYSTNQSKKFNYDNFSTVGFQIGVVFLDL